MVAGLFISIFEINMAALSLAQKKIKSNIKKNKDHAKRTRSS